MHVITGTNFTVFLLFLGGGGTVLLPVDMCYVCLHLQRLIKIFLHSSPTPAVFYAADVIFKLIVQTQWQLPFDKRVTRLPG